MADPLPKVLARVCVFAASADGSASFRDAAIEVGTALAQREITVVYGGVNIGLMSAAADAALTAGGEVVGVVLETTAPDLIHRGLTALHKAPSMHARKACMAELSDAFVALPGGLPFSSTTGSARGPRGRASRALLKRGRRQPGA